MSSLFVFLLILCFINQATCIGGGSWFEGKRSPKKRSIQCGIRWHGQSSRGFKKLRRSTSVYDNETFNKLENYEDNFDDDISEKHLTIGNIQCGIRWYLCSPQTISSEFKRIKSDQNKLIYLRKLCKTIIKNSKENEGSDLVKACKKNLPL